MVDLLLHLLGIGIATALEPVQLVAYVGVLSMRRGVRAGWAIAALSSSSRVTPLAGKMRKS